MFLKLNCAPLLLFKLLSESDEMYVKWSKAGAFVLCFIKPEFGYVCFGCVRFTISFLSLDLFILDASEDKMRIISVLWRILPSGCNFYLQSGPSLSGSDSYDYQPTSLIRAARHSWQPRAELFYLQWNVPGLFSFKSVAQSASFSILRGNRAGDGKHIKPALSGETRQCWGRQTQALAQLPFFFFEGVVWGVSGFFLARYGFSQAASMWGFVSVQLDDPHNSWCNVCSWNSYVDTKGHMYVLFFGEQLCFAF